MKRLMIAVSLLASFAFASCEQETPTTIAVTEVTVKAATSIVVGTTEQLTATLMPENATNKELTWTSDKPEVATVSADGLVSGVSLGEATITVTADDGKKRATCKVTVAEASIAVTGIELNKTSTTLSIGGKETLTATFTPANATNQNMTWTSDKLSVATVSETGEVTGVAAGTANITVTTEDGSKTATCAVTVMRSVTGITLNKTTSKLYIDITTTLKATIAPANATNKNFTWSTDKPEVATVSANGDVEGKSVGTATITVTTEDGGKTAKCVFTVEKMPLSVGQFYYADGSYSPKYDASKSPVGVVAVVDDNKVNGKLISLDEAMLEYYNVKELKEGGDPNNSADWIDAPKIFYAQDMNDGFANTEKIKTIDVTLATFPAFKWCVEKASVNGKTWYLPAFNEIKAVIAGADLINAALESAGLKKIDLGTSLTDQRLYTSSSEHYDDDNGEESVALWTHFLVNTKGTLITEQGYKWKPYKTRAMVAF